MQIAFIHASMAENNILRCTREYFAKPNVNPDRVTRIDIVLSGDTMVPDPV